MLKPQWWALVEPDADIAIRQFNEKLRNKLSVSPEKIIRRKNPFLLRARTEGDAKLFAQMITEAYLSSSEETMFGNLLEDVAITICKHSKGGWKSSAEKIDLEYMNDTVRCIVQIKSGPNWGNSSQKQAMKAAFLTAKRILRQGNPNLEVKCIEGICYGKSHIQLQGTHDKYVGHEFWNEISGWEGSANAVLELIGNHASNGLRDVKTDACDRIIEYMKTYGVAVPQNSKIRRTDQSIIQYTIDWNRLLEIVFEAD